MLNDSIEYISWNENYFSDKNLKEGNKFLKIQSDNSYELVSGNLDKKTYFTSHRGPNNTTNEIDYANFSTTMFTIAGRVNSNHHLKGGIRNKGLFGNNDMIY